MRKFFWLIPPLIIIASCGRNGRINHKHNSTLFQLLSPDSTNIHFANMVDDTGDITVFNNLYMYNGGGVAVGDVNNDGLQDIFFTSNQGKSCLYLNRGSFRFTDVTENSGIDTRGGWVTGVVMADVNGDGSIDIYICRGGSRVTGDTHNLLFINDGKGHFVEAAKEFGVDDGGYSTQAAFLDYDNDGDLDLYVMNYPAFDSDPLNYYSYKTTDSDYVYSDHLYKNENNHFIDVTIDSKLPNEKGYGLGLVVSDINMDGWVDIYVGNDWAIPDYVYINDKNGGFVNQAGNYFSKSAFFSMGVDIADINNDGIPDVSVCDMVPASHERRNIHTSQAPIDYFFMEKKFGGVPQYSRNFVQVSQPYGSYRELSEAFGLAKTDWSWSSLLADYDNDGWRDIFVTNGMKRDEGDMDYERLMFKEGQKSEYKRGKKALIEKMPQTLLANYIFKNHEGQSFIKKMNDWGLDQLINAQGAAYADLNNDGQLDLVLNVSDAASCIYRNTGEKYENLNGHHYLRISIKGQSRNTAGLGTKAWVFSNGKLQYSELSSSRGFQSSSEHVLHFGLGNDTLIDSLLVVFPSSGFITMKNLTCDQHLILNEDSSEGKSFQYKKEAKVNYSLVNADFKIVPAFVHHESDFIDFKRDKLLPRMFSKEGPALAVGDLNSDGLEDFYVGGGAGQSGEIYLQNADGVFNSIDEPALKKDLESEDVAALIGDLNGDGNNDLYVVSGSNEFPSKDVRYQDRIYLSKGNQVGKGNGASFIRCADCLPEMIGSKSCIAALDFDNDGDLDLFIGGRTVVGSYGEIPKSYLLQNDKGIFQDVISVVAPSLEYAGMVTSSQWLDVDGDGAAELLIAGDWMSPTVFKFQNGKFQDITSLTGLQNYKGWWSCIASGDFDHDGDLDFACGNWGLNSVWKATDREPLSLLVNDFDGNGSVDPILCCYLEGKAGTFLGRDLICQSMPKYANKFKTYESFAKTELKDLFSKNLYDGAIKLSATELRSSIFINSGKGSFKIRPLPFECQVAPINSIEYFDLNGDGIKDLLLAGNTNQNFYDQGDIDGFQGVLLNGDSSGNFSPMTYMKCGVKLDKFVRQTKIIANKRNSYLICANNSDTLQLFTIKKQ